VEHAPREAGRWVEEAELEMEIDGLIHKLGNLDVQGIDTSVRGVDWATVDDYIGEDGGPLAVDFDQVLQLLDEEREEEWEEPPADGPEVPDDEEDGDGAGEPSSRPRPMTFEAAITAAHNLSSFLMDVGDRQEDLAMAASLNTLTQRLHELRVANLTQTDIESFFPPQQTSTEDYAGSSTGADGTDTSR